MYKLVLLDADETIFDFKKAERVSLFQCFKSYNLEHRFDELFETYKEINHQLWKDLEEGKLGKDRLNFLRFNGLIDAFNLNIDVSDISEQYVDELGKCSYLIEGAKELCEYLNEKYKVFILTNGIKKTQIARFENSEIKHLIDGMVISGDVGVSKPDSKIFDHTLNKAKHSDKTSVIMIGDSLSADIKGGNSYGVDTIWVNLKKVDNHTDIKGTYEVRGLKEIYDIL